MNLIAYRSDGLGPNPVILTSNAEPDESWVGRRVEINDYVWLVEKARKVVPHPDRAPVAADYEVVVSKRPVGPGRNIDC